MTATRTFAKAASWTLLVYCAACWGVAVWVSAEGVASVTRPGNERMGLGLLMGINIMLLATVVPDRKSESNFWLGLFRFRPATLDRMRKFFRIVEISVWMLLAVVIARSFLIDRPLDSDQAIWFGYIILIGFLTYPAVKLAVLAWAGRDGIHERPIPASRRSGIPANLRDG